MATTTATTTVTTAIRATTTVAKALHGQRFPMPPYIIGFINISYSVSFVVRGQWPRRGR